jgi:uncharacterized protein
MQVSELNIYPIKSLKGISLQSAVVQKRGLECDRRWVIVDADGKFLTQREWPRMATVTVEVTGDGLQVTGNGSGTLKIEPLTDGPRLITKIWERAGGSIAYGVETNEWFSDVLGRQVELRYMPDDAWRPVNPIFDAGGDVNSFADGSPALLANEASMADLNSRMETPLPINRFRPNIVVSGAEPWAEDKWKKVRIGEAIFRVVKPSDRCVLTTVDPEKGEFAGKEPLKTLATFRMSKDVHPETYAAFALPPNSVLFGENTVPDTPGATIRVGDEVEVIEFR